MPSIVIKANKTEVLAEGSEETNKKHNKPIVP